MISSIISRAIAALSALLLIVCISQAESDSKDSLAVLKSDTAIPHLATPNLDRFLDAADSIPGPRSALLAGSLSAVFPGAGQVYGRRYVKGGIFLAAEGVAAAVAAQRFWYAGSVNKASENDALFSAGLWADSFAVHSGISDTAWRRVNLSAFRSAESKVGISRQDRLSAEFTANQAIAWTAGIHVFNVMDAIGTSRQFDDDRSRKPAVGALLSAVPFLGLGQIYNGAFSRTGFVMMSQGCLAYMAWNNQRLMDNAVGERLVLKNLKLVEETTDYNNAIADWDGRYKEAFTRRNTYLWYFVLMYFYGIADAAVDAQLHDFKGRMRIVPAADIGNDGKPKVGMSATGSF